MTATLILMRHAKAIDRLEAEDDFQRGLTARGREDAAAAADALAGHGLSAELALVSPAWRTRQTFDVVASRLGDPEIEDPMALYHASTEMLERAARQALDQAGSVLLVGHNPGIGGFAHKLAIAAGQAGRLPQGFPTAAAAAFDLADGTPDRPRLIALFNPRD